MSQTAFTSGREHTRNLLVMSKPALWPAWPFLPLVRRTQGAELECGLLYDQSTDSEPSASNSVVYLGNLFQLPGSVDEFLDQPKEEYLSFEAIYAAGWRVD